MASSAPARSRSLHRDDWIRAALSRLAKDGIQEVCVEVLARDLAVSKGSFYWHFRDRGDLLTEALTQWEAAECSWMQRDSAGSPAANRWAEFIERSSNPAQIRLEVAIRAWARADERVAARVLAIEKRRIGMIEEVLRDVGFAAGAAQAWSETIFLACLGWIDQAARDPQPRAADLGSMLSGLILAASARSSSSDGHP